MGSSYKACTFSRRTGDATFPFEAQRCPAVPGPELVRPLAPGLAASCARATPCSRGRSLGFLREAINELELELYHPVRVRRDRLLTAMKNGCLSRVPHVSQFSFQVPVTEFPGRNAKLRRSRAHEPPPSRQPIRRQSRSSNYDLCAAPAGVSHEGSIREPTDAALDFAN